MINDSFRFLKKDVLKISYKWEPNLPYQFITALPFLPFVRNWNPKMGISLNQWRSSIGSFFLKTKCNAFLHFPHPTSKLKKKEQCIDIRHFMMFFTLLVVCGCIEKNPGPTHEVSFGLYQAFAINLNFTKVVRLGEILPKLDGSTRTPSVKTFELSTLFERIYNFYKRDDLF